MDFTEIIPTVWGYKYLLVFVDTDCPNSYKKVLQGIIPKLLVFLALGSDNDLTFIAKLLKSDRYKNIYWKLHCAYRPQSSGQVERANRTLKEILTKLVLETGETWANILLRFVLLRVQCSL